MLAQTLSCVKVRFPMYIADLSLKWMFQAGSEAVVGVAFVSR